MSCLCFVVNVPCSCWFHMSCQCIASVYRVSQPLPVLNHTPFFFGFFQLSVETPTNQGELLRVGMCLLWVGKESSGAHCDSHFHGAYSHVGLVTSKYCLDMYQCSMTSCPSKKGYHKSLNVMHPRSELFHSAAGRKGFSAAGSWRVHEWCVLGAPNCCCDIDPQETLAFTHTTHTMIWDIHWDNPNQGTIPYHSKHDEFRSFHHLSRGFGSIHGSTFGLQCVQPLLSLSKRNLDGLIKRNRLIFWSCAVLKIVTVLVPITSVLDFLVHEML